MTTIVDGQAGITFNDASTQGTAGYTGFRNRIINGAMVIDQRNAGAAITPSSTQYTVDRWNFANNVASKITLQQNKGAVTPPVGFANYLGATTSTAYSVGVNDYLTLYQAIEGYNTVDFAWGTGTAKTVTLSFWVYSSIAGVFGGSLQGITSTYRSYPFLYNINAANTWQFISIVVPGDTGAPAGGWNTTNGYGCIVWLGLGVGTTFSGSAGSWASANYVSAVGATSMVATQGANFYVTGLQLEVGVIATPFERRLYNVELAMCQRYYYQQSANTPIVGQTAFFSIPFNLPVTMRTSPSVGYPYTDATFTSSGSVPSGQWGIQYVGASAASKTGTVAFSYATPTANSGMIYTTGATWSQTTNWLQSTNLAAVTSVRSFDHV